MALLQGCFLTSKKPLDVRLSSDIDRASFEINLPRPDPVKSRKVDFTVLSNPSPLICLTPKEYEDLSFNMVEILKFIKGARKYMDESDKLIKVLSEEANR